MQQRQNNFQGRATVRNVSQPRENMRSRSPYVPEDISDNSQVRTSIVKRQPTCSSKPMKYKPPSIKPSPGKFLAINASISYRGSIPSDNMRRMTEETPRGTIFSNLGNGVKRDAMDPDESVGDESAFDLVS